MVLILLVALMAIQPCSAATETKTTNPIIFYGACIVLLIIGGAYLYSLWNAYLTSKESRKDTLEAIAIADQAMADLPPVYRKARDDMKTLKKIAPKELWDHFPSLIEIRIESFQSRLRRIKKVQNKLWNANEIFDRAEAIRRDIVGAKRECDNIVKLLEDFQSAKERCSVLIPEIDRLFAEKKALIEASKITTSTKLMFDMIGFDKFNQIKGQHQFDEVRDWIRDEEKLGEMKHNLGNVRHWIAEDEKFFQKAKEEGPTRIKDLSKMIQTVEKKISSAKTYKDHTYLVSIKDDLVKVEAALADNTVDWAEFMVLANSVDSLETFPEECSESPQ